MNKQFAERLRDAARAPLPEGAFLRRDRGDALFVSDAPRRCPQADWAVRFTRAGFRCEISDGLARLSPGAAWAARLEAAYPEPPDFFCASLKRFAGMPPDGEALRLFALGARVLDGGDGFSSFDRRLRQRAAEALRAQSPSIGGGLYACALTRYLICEKEEA